jgi:hypothetical protein
VNAHRATGAALGASRIPRVYLANKTIATVNTAIVTSNTLWPQRAMSPSMVNLQKIPMIQFGKGMNSRAALWTCISELLNRRGFWQFQKMIG